MPTSDTYTPFLQEPEPKDREQLLEAYLKLRLQSLDRAVAGYTSVSLAGLSGNIDLTPTQAKNRVIKLSGAPSGAVTVRIPATTGANADIVFVNVCTGSNTTVTVKSMGANLSNPAGVTLTKDYTRVVRHDGESAYPVTGEILSLTSTLNNNLVAFWRLEEASGTRNDAVSTNHLTDNNTVTQAAGKVGNAALFVRANSEYLSCADNAALSTGDIDYTGCCWVKLTTKQLCGLFAKESSGTVREYRLDYDSASDRFRFFAMDAGGVVVGSVTANNFGAPALGVWVFIVFWHDAVNNQVGIQVNNGTANTAATTGAPADTAAVFTLGAFLLSNYLDGALDAVGFWKKVLTAAEKTELYNGGAGREYPF